MGHPLTVHGHACPKATKWASVAFEVALRQLPRRCLVREWLFGFIWCCQRAFARGR